MMPCLPVPNENVVFPEIFRFMEFPQTPSDYFYDFPLHFRCEKLFLAIRNDWCLFKFVFCLLFCLVGFNKTEGMNGIKVIDNRTSRKRNITSTQETNICLEIFFFGKLCLPSSTKFCADWRGFSSGKLSCYYRTFECFA